MSEHFVGVTSGSGWQIPVWERDDGSWAIGDLDSAWAEAEAALPEFWEIGSLMRTDDDRWSAEAQLVLGGGVADTLDAERETPAAALRALAAKLREAEA